MDITPINNYLELARQRVLAQFKDSPNIDKLLDVLIQQLQNFEDTLIQVLRNRWVNTAQGVQLDGLGSIVGIERLGLTDDQYRLAIKLQIGINTSTGTAASVISIMKIITESNIVELSENFPACIDMWVSGTSIDEFVVNTIYKILSAGVCFRLRIGEHPFGFFGDPTAYPLGSSLSPLDPLPGFFCSIVVQ